MKTPLSVVVLALDEEKNIAQCLTSVTDWAGQVFVVVDDRTTDNTVACAKRFGVEVIVRSFGGFVEQRNWALQNLPFKNEWAFFIDADEYPTDELKREVGKVITSASAVDGTEVLEQVTPPTSPYYKGRLGGVKEIISVNQRNDNQRTSALSVNGYYMKRRFMFWGRWLKHGGYYPVWILRLMRHRAARCEGMLMDEHFAVGGTTGRLANDLIHDDRRGLLDWLQKHRRYAELKARERLAGESAKGPTGDDAASRERAAKRRTWDRLPLFVRPFLYWGYVMFVRGGILDGVPGIVYHTLHGFWYPFLIDVKIHQLSKQ